MNTRFVVVSFGLLLCVTQAIAAALPPAPHIENVLISGGQTRLSIQSDAGLINRVLYATNVTQPNWVIMTNLIVSQSPWGFVATNSPAAAARFYRVAASPTNAPDGMSLIPGGNFVMGDILDGSTNALPLHTVYLSPFYMDQNLVTKTLWDDVFQWATNHGYVFSSIGSFGDIGLGKAANHPVHTITWDNAVKWCNARSEKEGLAPCYFTDLFPNTPYRSERPGRVSNSSVRWTANGYRLPTEAEWEKAARGGISAQRFPFGNLIQQAFANYHGCTNCYGYDAGPDGYNPIGSLGGISPATSPVGSFSANDHGLYDMAGNVQEWCWDWYLAAWYSDPASVQNDPRGPASPGLATPFPTTRVTRGGSWADAAAYARCSDRRFIAPDLTRNFLGFRCVRGL